MHIYDHGGCGTAQAGERTSSVSSSRFTSTRSGSVMNLLVISSTSPGSVALTSTTCAMQTACNQVQHTSSCLPCTQLQFAQA